MPLTSLGLRGGGFLLIMEIKFTPQDLIGKINELEKVILPRAAFQSLNRAVFVTSRQVLRDRASSTFISKVPFTLNSFLYDRPVATTNQIESRIYIRDEAPKGNAPADYLLPQIEGGPIFRTRFQRILQRIPDPDPGSGMGLGGLGPINAPNEVMIPTGSSLLSKQTGARRTGAGGGMSRGQYSQILTDLTDSSSADFDQISMRREGARLKRKAMNEKRKAKGLKPKKLGRYFYMNREMIGNRPGLKSKQPGIFYRFPNGRLSKVMSQTLSPQYTKKFDFIGIAKESVEKTFKEELLRNLKRIL